MGSFIQAREKGVKKAKKTDFAKTKTEIYKQQNLLSHIRCVTFFTSVIQFKKKKEIRFWPKMTDYEFFCETSSNLGPFLTSKGYKRA